MDDKEIVALYFARSEDAIACTQEKYGSLLLSISQRITEDPLDAQECVSDTYMQAWQRIPPQKPTFLGAWLAKITRHISLNVCRLRHTQKRSALITELSGELQQCIPGQMDAVDLDAAVLREALNLFLHNLDDSTQYIFVRRYFFAESLQEIARRTGRSEKALASILFRVRNKLRAQLEKEGITL